MSHGSSDAGERTTEEKGGPTPPACLRTCPGHNVGRPVARAALRRHQARSPYRSATYNDCADNPIAPDVS